MDLLNDNTSKEISRRDMLMNSGKVAAAAAMASLGLLQGTQKSDAYENTAATMYKYVKLDPRDVGQTTYENYFKRWCTSSVIAGFAENLKKKGVDLGRVTTVKGWFNASLTDENAKKFHINKVAAAWIDCDLYESTVPVLDFLTPRISVGTVLLFDDWRCFRNLPDYGEQKACREWLAKNPQITLHELFSFGWHGIAFTVGSC